MKYTPTHTSCPCNNTYYAAIPALKFVYIIEKKDTNDLDIKVCNQD